MAAQCDLNKSSGVGGGCAHRSRFQLQSAIRFDSENLRIFQPQREVLGQFSCFTWSFPELNRNAPNIPPTELPQFTDLDFSPNRSTKRRKIESQATARRTILSSRTPVKHELPLDAWICVFKRCDPKFLLEARRVCRSFHDILKGQSIWREARRHQYGVSLPKCPAGLNEFQYTNLLCGQGCQNPGCTRAHARKVYWPFLRRWCDQCFALLTTTKCEDVAAQQLFSTRIYSNLNHELQERIGPHLTGLLPAAECLSARYHGCRTMRSNFQRWDDPQQLRPFIWRRRDIEEICRELRNLAIDSELDCEKWARDRFTSVSKSMKAATSLERVFKFNSVNRTSIRENRRELFVQRAAQMNPAVSEAVLEKFAAYQSALKSVNQASERSWAELEVKIQDEDLQRLARQLCAWQREENKWFHSYMDGPFDRLNYHRSTRLLDPKFYQAEQKFVIRLARTLLSRYEGKIHDEDLLLYTLHMTWKHYYSLDEERRPHGLNADCKCGPYKLLLDDVRMIIAEVFQKSEAILPRLKAILGQLKCRGCKTPAAKKMYHFEGLMRHIREKHAVAVAPGDSFWYFACPIRSSRAQYHATSTISWFQVLWPKSLPALPRHADVPKDPWHPNREEAYVLRSQHQSLSAFEGRCPASDPAITKGNFGENFSKAARLLIPTRLDGVVTLKIALSYALQRLQSANSVDGTHHLPTLDDMDTLLGRTQKLNPKLDLKFKCASCHRSPRHELVGQHVDDWHWMKSHWRAWHEQNQGHWSENLFALPSDSELLLTIEREDRSLREEQARARTKLTKMGKDSRSIDPRTLALLDTPKIMNVFEQLFPRNFETTLEYD